METIERRLKFQKILLIIAVFLILFAGWRIEYALTGVEIDIDEILIGEMKK